MAELTCTPGALATCEDPTGSADPMYWVTTASRMAARRCAQGAVLPARVGSGGGVSGWSHGCLALKFTECQRHPPVQVAGLGRGSLVPQSSPKRNAEMNASWGTSTRPMFFIRFLPSFCFSSSLRLRVMSPP